MSKRLVRLFSAHLPDQINTLTGIDLHVVLYDGNTAFGRLKNHTPESFNLVDLRGYIHSFEYAEVEVVIFEKSSKKEQLPML
ncbi:hypothetical protein [Arundinibacter roseus]|uniref:Uncharacterized protein n=1 Tax=Arundinibacter roseus TaxID=2070510 RepID=A0A4R4KMH7_9BACT|nr:hypothetical protein [Arundinibacter roseus]TDB68202.1 hypothetical protein EZE20_04575 [Arundinibacter roseus]